MDAGVVPEDCNVLSFVVVLNLLQQLDSVLLVEVTLLGEEEKLVALAADGTHDCCQLVQLRWYSRNREVHLAHRPSSADSTTCVED